jgi:hypothetical protein
MFSHLLEPCVKIVDIFNDFVETFSKSWQFPFKKIIEFATNKPPNFWKSENLHQKNGWSPTLE